MHIMPRSGDQGQEAPGQVPTQKEIRTQERAQAHNRWNTEEFAELPPCLGDSPGMPTSIIHYGLSGLAPRRSPAKPTPALPDLIEPPLAHRPARTIHRGIGTPGAGRWVYLPSKASETMPEHRKCGRLPVRSTVGHRMHMRSHGNGARGWVEAHDTRSASLASEPSCSFINSSKVWSPRARGP